MRPTIAFTAAVVAAITAPAYCETVADRFDSASGRVEIVGGPSEKKSVAVGPKILPLEDYYASFRERAGNLILIETSSGGFACASMFVWLDTTPGRVRLSEPFGTCSDSAEVTDNGASVRVTMPAGNGSAGFVAFDYDGSVVTERLLGLRSSAVAKRANGIPTAWIGQSPYEYVTAPENEANLIDLIGWDDLDALRNSIVVGSQKMTVDGDWIVGSGCRPHVCNTDFAAIALHKGTGSFVAAIKKDGERPKLLGKPTSALPADVRRVMTASHGG